MCVGTIKNHIFDDKLIEEYLEDYEDNLIITEEIENAIQKWLKKLNNKELINEENNYPKFYEIILHQILGYTSDDYITEGTQSDRQRPDIIFKKDNEDYVVCELKGSKTDIEKRYNGKRSAIDQVTIYANKNEEIKWSFVSNYNEFRLIYASATEKYISFDFECLTDPHNLKIFLLIFSKFSLIDKKIPETLLKETKVIQEKFEDKFYELFSETRLMIIRELEYFNANSEEFSLSLNDKIYYAQLILNRYLFICFAEDLKILDPFLTTETLINPLSRRTISKNKLWKELNELFETIYEGNEYRNISEFGGVLFEEKLVNKLNIRDLVRDQEEFFEGCYKNHGFQYDNVEVKKYKDLNPIFKNLLIISSFDFESELDVNILGHIFESSLKDIDELKKNLEKENDIQTSNGIYYTSEYVTDYMCKNAIVSQLSKSGNAQSIDELIDEYKESGELDLLDEKLKNIKILDPACGSGAFLNKSVDVLFKIHEVLHRNKFENDMTLYRHFDNLENRKAIVKNNIYGVDLNRESVELTKLSLFLKLATSFKLEKGFKLPNLDNNIKCGNSLISDKNIVGNNAFNWEKEFDEIINDGGFDVVIGNPPYIKAGLKDEEYQKQRAYLNTSTEYVTLKEKWDYYVAFIEKGLHLLKERGELSFLISDSYALSEFSEESKKYIFDNFHFKKIDFFPNIKLFKNANVKNIILTVDDKKSDNLPTERILHDCEFDNMIKLENTTDPQKIFRFEDYELDKFSKNSKLLSEICLVTKGLQPHSSNSYNLKFKKDDVLSEVQDEIYNKPYVENKDLRPYGINKIRYLEWGTERVPDNIYRKTFPELYINPKLIVGKIGKNYIYDEEKMICNDSCYVLTLHHYLKGVENRSINKARNNFSNPNKRSLEELELISMQFNLKYILAILNSKFMRKYLNLTSHAVIKDSKYVNDLKYLPIKEISLDDQEVFVDLVDNIMLFTADFIKEQNSFIKWLNNYYNTNINLDTNSSLKKYYNLDFNEFFKKIKNKTKIKNREDTELLENEFTKSLSKLNSLKNKIIKLSDEIDDNVFELYELSDEDKKSIKETYKQEI